MGSMKNILFAVLVSSFCCAVSAAEYKYNQTVKGRDFVLTVRVTDDKDVRSITASDDLFLITNQVKLVRGKGVVEWKLTDEKNKSNISAVRENNLIKISGVYKGSDFKREHGIDGREWHQVFNWEFDEFFNSGKKEMEFWAIRPDDPNTCGVMVVKNEGVQKLTVLGKEEECVYSKVTLAGLLSVFWTGEYWYRKSDLLYVKAKPTGDSLVDLSRQP